MGMRITFVSLNIVPALRTEFPKEKTELLLVDDESVGEGGSSYDKDT
jgi:hypothetical protein